MSELKGKQKKYLRGLAHSFDPVVIVGKRGVTAAVLRQIDTALEDHELIKIKLSAECPDERDEVAEKVTAENGCTVAGAVGRVLILYRARKENPSIKLPSSTPTPNP